MFDVGLAPVREWRLADLAVRERLGNWRGLAIVHADGDTELVVAVGPSAAHLARRRGLAEGGGGVRGGGRASLSAAGLAERLRASG